MRKKNLSIIIVLLAALLIIYVIWFYNKRIENLDRNQYPLHTKGAPKYLGLETITINHPGLPVKAGQYETIGDLPHQEHLPV